MSPASLFYFCVSAFIFHFTKVDRALFTLHTFERDVIGLLVIFSNCCFLHKRRDTDPIGIHGPKWFSSWNASDALSLEANTDSSNTFFLFFFFFLSNGNSYHSMEYRLCVPRMHDKMYFRLCFMLLQSLDT